MLISNEILLKSVLPDLSPTFAIKSPLTDRLNQFIIEFTKPRLEYGMKSNEKLVYWIMSEKFIVVSSGKYIILVCNKHLFIKLKRILIKIPNWL